MPGDHYCRRCELSWHDIDGFFVTALTGFKPGRDQAILVCGSGIGMAMAANKIPGIRAVAAVMPTEAKLARQDEDANVLAMGAWLVKPATVRRILHPWLTTKASQAVRHRRRRRQLASLDR